MQSPVLVERVPVVDIATSAHSSFLEGKWVNTEDELEVIDPATGQPFAKVSKIDHGHLIQGSGRRRGGFRAVACENCCGAWGGTPPRR